MELVDALDDAANFRHRLTFLPGGTQVPLASIWRRASDSTGWMVDHGTSVGMVMESTAECIVAVFAAFQAGIRLVSVPVPPRGGTMEDYQALVLRICAAAEIQCLLVDPSYLPLIPDIGLPIFGFDECETGKGPPRSAGVGEFVQFTSGSTSEPKGVRLGLDKLYANISAILDVVEPSPGDAAVSWLPLSHDMGFVGMGLAALCAGAGHHTGGGEVVLIQPAAFIRRPELWLEVCSEFRATFTAAPDFGFQLAIRRGVGRRTLDLSPIRVCITGAEPVRGDTLREFSETFAPYGFDPIAFCPAYGLAEVGLAASMTAPKEMWTSVRVDRDRLAAGHLRVSADENTELVSAGLPLPGYLVAPAATDLGPLTIEGPSTFDGYLGDPDRADGSPLVTNDQGFVLDGRVYVAGRTDDVLLIAGRKIFPLDLELTVAKNPGVRHGNAAAIGDGAGGYVIVAERTESRSSPTQTAGEVRAALVAGFGVGPASIIFVSRGTLPKTSSGKPRRWETTQRHIAESLSVEHVSVYR